MTSFLVGFLPVLAGFLTCGLVSRKHVRRAFKAGFDAGYESRVNQEQIHMAIKVSVN